MTTALAQYAETLSPQRVGAEEAYAEGVEMWGIVESWSIQSSVQYAQINEILKDVKAKRKFLDDERKISVTPLNDEVGRINDWYRPALTKLAQIAEHASKLMGAFVLRQRQEEQRLLQEAEKLAQAVLASHHDVAEAMAPAAEMVQQAAETAAPKLKGTTAKTVWTFVVTDAAAFVRAHPELSMPDPKKLSAWIATHGDKSVPVGVEVREDVKIGTRVTRA